MELPEGFQSQFVERDGTRLHVVHNVQPDDPRERIVFLHGFPEFWIAWRDVFGRLADTHAIIAPDLRGFNLSDAPSGVEAYHARETVADVIAIAFTIGGKRPFVLAGHDWGASIAYAAAIRFPKFISKLIIANGVHPVVFQEAIIDDPEQRQASQYFHILQADHAAERMSENGYARAFSMLEKFSDAPWITAQLREEYLGAWSQPGRMHAMLNWYRASPVMVPRMDETPEPPPLYRADRSAFQVTMPHLLVWGDADQALRPSSMETLAQFCPDLTVRHVSDAGHWLLHTHADAVAGHIGAFLRSDG